MNKVIELTGKQHKIVEVNGRLYVKEKANGASMKWVFVDSGGIETYDEMQVACFCENQDHAERIVNYRKGQKV